jgi:hypothetical protein
MATDPKPDAVVRAERILGSAATAWSRVTSGGWSVNEHWRVELENGELAFLKHADRVEPCPTWLRDEYAVYSTIDGPFLPRLLGWEDSERPLLVLEDLSPGGRWPPPWQPGGIDAVLAALREAAATPVRAPLPLLAEDSIGGWSAVARDPEPFLGLELVTQAWLEDALPALLDASRATPLDGTALLHCDVRSDNLCLRDGRAILFDWSHGRLGNPEFDVAFWLPSLALEGGPQPDAFGVDAFAVYVAGFFAGLAGLRPPPGAPAVRGFQLAQLEVALPWARRVLGLS